MKMTGVVLNGKPITSVVSADTTTNSNTSTGFDTGSGSTSDSDGGSSTNGMRSDSSGGGELVNDEDYLWGLNVRAWSVILSCGTYVQYVQYAALPRCSYLKCSLLSLFNTALARVRMLGAY
jgi:hypothetical protein